MLLDPEPVGLIVGEKAKALGVGAAHADEHLMHAAGKHAAPVPADLDGRRAERVGRRRRHGRGTAWCERRQQAKCTCLQNRSSMEHRPDPSGASSSGSKQAPPWKVCAMS